MDGSRVSASLERAVKEAENARRTGHPTTGAERLEATLASLDDGPTVSRARLVGLHHEKGLCHLSLCETDDARASFSRALESAGSDWKSSDPARAALALLELMAGRVERAQARLAGRGKDRHATLVSLARMNLSLGRIELALDALDRADHAPGSSPDIHPPTSSLRALASVWNDEPQQGQALIDGLGEPGDPFWLLTRMLTYRAMWVAKGKSGHLILAVGAAQELAFITEGGRAPAFRAVALGQLALLHALTGDTLHATEIANQALEALTSLSLPEWPREAILHDIGIVFREAGDTQGQERAIARLEAPPSKVWTERMLRVSGARASGALERPSTYEKGTALDGLAISILEHAGAPHGALLRGLMKATGAHGARWRRMHGQLVAAAGSGCTHNDGDAVTIPLDQNEAIDLLGCTVDVVMALDRTTLDHLVAAARALALDQEKIEALCEALNEATTRRDSAVRALERARRGPVAAVTGGTFPAVAGSSRSIRAVLDRLGLLASCTTTVLIEGLPGSGRRHLARALHGALGGVLGECPMLDMNIVPEEAMRDALLRLEHEADGGVFVASSAGSLPPDTLSWLLNRLETGEMSGRLVLTLDVTASGPIAETLREHLVHGRVIVPALEDRLEDLPAVVDALALQLGVSPEAVDPGARTALSRRTWPGQIREVKQVLAAAAIRAGGGVIREEHLTEPSSTKKPDRMARSLDAGYHDAVRSFRRDLLRHALTVSDGNRTHAAERLGVQRTYFMRLIRDLGADDIRPAA